MKVTDLSIPSGYILLEYCPESKVVLAFNPDYTLSKYAVWHVAYDGGMCQGDYTPKIGQAVLYFEERVNKPSRHCCKLA
jgi:hypothetical protein